jgi:hypothetical protein
MNLGAFLSQDEDVGSCVKECLDLFEAIECLGGNCG